jgi:hypothetical protein
LFWILTNGVVRQGMPVWSKLPEPQRWQIVTFVKSLTPSGAAEPAVVHNHIQKPNRSRRVPQDRDKEGCHKTATRKSEER